MIRINLLPTKKVKKRKKTPPLLVLAVFLLFLAMGGIGYAYYWQTSKIKRLDGEIIKADNELKRLEDISKLVAQYEKDKKELARKIEIISKLSTGQKRPVHLMDTISRAMPEDIWLSNITTSDTNLKISGYALSSVGVSHFMTRLKDSPYFQNVDLVESSATTYERSTVYRFELTCVLKS